MAQEGRQPVFRWQAVRVDESHQRRRRRRQTDVARQVAGPSLTGNAMNDAPPVREIFSVREASAEASSATMHASPSRAIRSRRSCSGRSSDGDDDGDVVGGEASGARSGQKGTRRHQAAGQQLVGTPCPRPRPPPARRPSAPGPAERVGTDRWDYRPSRHARRRGSSWPGRRSGRSPAAVGLSADRRGQWSGRARRSPGGDGHVSYLGRHGDGSAADRLTAQWEEAMVLAEDQDVHEAEALADDDVDDLLVEEVSIDGMCGVY